MKIWYGAVGALVLASCGQGSSEPVVLVASAPASAAECPFGGAVVSSGTDDNRDGRLDDAEIADRTVVCNAPPPPPPPATLVRLVAEPAGAHCPLDGTAVQSGPDRNGNGALDDDEVTRVVYACGEPLLTRLAPAPPDARCVAGGVAFLAGRDRNHDGQLEDAEIEQRQVTCGDELAGDLAIRDAVEATALAGVAVIAGSLTVHRTALRELVLPRLVQVRGGFHIDDNPDLVGLSLPALQSVDGPLTLARDPMLTSIDVPALRRLGGLVIDGDVALSELGAVAAIPEVTGDVQISNNDALSALDLTIGQIGGGLVLDGNARLASAAVSSTGELGAVHIGGNPVLARIAIGGVDGGRLAEVARVIIESNRALGDVALAATDLGPISIFDSPVLSDARVTGARIRGDVWLVGNGELRLAFSAVAPDAFTIEGSLHVAGPTTAITSTRPLVVNRDCVLEGTHLAAFGPDQVSRVGSGLRLRHNSRMTEISTIPIGDGLEITGNHALTELGFQLGDQFHGSIDILDNAGLQAVPFEGLRSMIGDVTVDGNPALKLFAPSLEEVTGDLEIQRNDGLSDLGLTRLRHAGGLRIASCPSLTQIDLPALSDVTIFGAAIVDNAQLRSVRFPVLRRADLRVLGNPRLAACEVVAMFAQVLGHHEQRLNDDTAECSP